MEAYESLCNRLNLQLGIPYTPNWSAGADFLQIIVDHCLQTKPGFVLECSSGLTSLMLARCCEINGNGQLLSLENGEEYADNTRGTLERYGLGGVAQVIHAPLVKTPLNGVDYLWYSTDKLPDRSVEMLVIDGPSGFIQKNSRYPALPLLYPRLADGCRVFLDDAARDDEQEILRLWKASYPEIELEEPETERGCAILTIHKSRS